MNLNTGLRYWKIRFSFTSLLCLLCLVVITSCGQSGTSSSKQQSNLTQPSPTSTTSLARSTVPSTNLTPTGTVSASFPTPTPTTQGVWDSTSGPTTIGSRFSNFVGKYGQPTTPPPSQVNASEPARTVGWTLPDMYLVITGATYVTGVGVNAPAGVLWDERTTQRMCFQFMPSDAVYDSTDTGIVHYHSATVGSIWLTPTRNQCILSLA